MESIIPKRKMLETALEQGEWQGCIDCLKSWSPAERKKILKKHEVQDTSTLHYLANCSMREEDGTLIYEIVKLFADTGYNINKKLYYRFPESPTSLPISDEEYVIVDCTALILAASVGNDVLVKCLIENGARRHLLDSDGQSAFDWAIFNGHLSCLKSLIFVRTARDETTQSKDMIYAYSLLHKAVKYGNQEIVAFLIENELCDPSKKAIVVLHSDHSVAPGEELSIALELIPLQVAILNGEWDIAAYLITNGSDISVIVSIENEHRMYTLWDSNIAGDFNSYELLLKLGDKEALPVLGAMLLQDIGKALHCTWFEVLRAAVKENQPDFLEQIFNHYAKEIRNDPNPTPLPTEVFTSPLGRNSSSPPPSPKWMADNWLSSIDEFTLLHFACIHKCSLDFIQKLLELGADVNLRTTGITKVTPLHISIIQEEWEHAKMLIENGAYLQRTALFISNTGFNLEIQSFNSIQLLLLQSGCRECGSSTNFFLSLMDQEQKLSWVGVKELYYAIIKGSPECVLKLLTHCAKTTPLKDLMWYRHEVNPSCKLTIPLLHGVLCAVGTDCCGHIYSHLPCLIRTFSASEYNYNFNSVAQGTIEGVDNYDFLLDLNFLYYTPILFHALSIDFGHSQNLLTEAIMENDHVELNVLNKNGQNTVERVLHLWKDKYSFYPPDEIQGKVNFVVDTIRMLLFKGTDVTSVSINEEFPYHSEFQPILKLLYRAGATITPSFFSPRPGFEPNSDDIQSLKIWKEQFDQQCKCSLKHRCRLFIRSMIKTVGDARKVMTNQPKQLQNYVLKLEESWQALN